MADFCTRCGASNPPGNAFCEQCGAPMKRAAAAAPPASNATPAPAAPARRKWLAVGAGAAVALVLAAGLAYKLLADPAPTGDRLLAAARAGHGAALGRQVQQQLCLGNLNYGEASLRVAPHDQHTQQWMAALVAAQLYAAPVQVVQPGLFGTTFLRYDAIGQLAAWREGRRLCLGRDVEVAAVEDIQPPRDERLGGPDAGPAVRAVGATLVLQARQTAPWLADAAVREPLLQQLPGWTYQDGRLQARQREVFGLRQGQWATGPAFKAELARQAAASRATAQADQDGADDHASQAPGILERLAQLLRLGGHPLQGSWRVDVEAMGQALGGVRLPPDLAPTLTFTRDSMQMAGEKLPCTFEVQGDRVRVIPEGQAQGLTFTLRGKDRMVADMGLVEIAYRRVP